VVTPSLDQAAYLEAAILSVRNQGYPDVEHVVVDGGSSDGTLAVLERHPGVAWTSEPDGGQAHAVNKGMSRVSGELVGWLNADDLYEPGALFRVAEAFAADPDLDVVYGDCFYLYEDVTPPEVRVVAAREFDLRFLLDEGCYIPQPAAFFRRRALAAGPLDETLRYVMDYEYWLRLGRAGARFGYVRAPLATFRVTGGSKSGAQLAAFWPEARRVSLAYGGRRFSPWWRRHLREGLAARCPRLYGWMKRVAVQAPGGRE